jgi:hypothetical protein
MLENGQRLVVHYPVSTHITAEPVFRRREFLVKGVRDLVRDPLTVQEYCNRTLVRRSRWLVHARDVQLGEWSGRDFDGLKLGVFGDDFDLINFDS